MRYIKMQREGEIANVADIEVAIWQAAGFEVCDGIQAEETEAQAETPPPVKRRGRPRKAD
jgi:hypothetical protein